MDVALAGPDLLPIRRVLISVSDKTGIVELARALAAHGVDILSTGGTAATLADAGIAVTDIATITGMPEMMDGRVKTLHPRVHGGLLAIRDDPGHLAAMESFDIRGIDCLIVNLYPFEAQIARGADFATSIENIDVGGPAMIRGAAKNAAWVAVVTDPGDYNLVGAALEAGGISRADRARLAAKAFARTAAYDAAIATWYANALGDELPDRILPAASLRERLRYGENPHQSAALYLTGEKEPRHRHGAAATGEAALLQQYQRRRRRLRADLRSAGGERGRRHRQARQSLRRGARAQPRRGLFAGARLRPGLRLWRHRRGEPAARPRRGGSDHRHLHRSRGGAGRRRGGRGRSSRRSPICDSSSPRGSPIRRRARCG